MILLKQGAFNISKEEALAPMSPYKWRKLQELAQKLNVTEYVHHPNLSNHSNPSHIIMPDATLFNRWTSRRLDEVREGEINAPDTSEQTLYLLDYIVSNAHSMIVSDINVRTIVDMGRHIRVHAKEIDYNKLNKWLAQIGLVQIASLQANILSACFEFSPYELPFRKKSFSKAERLYMSAIKNAFSHHSFSPLTRLNVAMIETLSYRFDHSLSAITDIEE